MITKNILTEVSLEKRSPDDIIRLGVDTEMSELNTLAEVEMVLLSCLVQGVLVFQDSIHSELLELESFSAITPIETNLLTITLMLLPMVECPETRMETEIFDEMTTMKILGNDLLRLVEA